MLPGTKGFTHYNKMYNSVALRSIIAMKLFKALPFVPLCFLFLVGFSQTKQINFKYLQTRGLSQNSVYCILKDHFGLMWFGTQAGLNKFDGYKFTVYTHAINDPKTIAANNIVGLFEDREGNIWIATKIGGVSKYDRGSESFINYQEKLNDPASLSSNQANLIYEDRRGNIWVGTRSGLNLFNKKTKKFVRYLADSANGSSLSNSWISAVYEDSKGDFWVATANGLNLMDRQTGKCTRYFQTPSKKNNISGNSINKMFEDSYGNMWLGTVAGLQLFDRATKQFTHYDNLKVNSNGKENDSRVRAIVQDEDFLWVGGTTLLLFDIKKKSYVDYIDHSHTENKIKDFDIYSLFLDDQHILWAGTSASGIYKYDKNLAHFSDFKLGHKNSRYNVIWSFAEDKKGNFWIGMEAGVSYFNRLDNSFTTYTHESKNKNSISGSGSTLLVTRENNDLWIGTDNGLDIYHPETGVFQHFTQKDGPFHLAEDLSILKLFEDSKGNIWIGTEDAGVVVLDKEKHPLFTFQHDPENPNSLSNNKGIYTICEDKEGNIFMSTVAGIDVFNPGTKQFKHYNSNNTSFLDKISTVFSLFADDKGNLWIGTIDGGLIKYNIKKNQYLIYSGKEGLTNNTINSIIEDRKGFLWLSTNGGIIRFDPVNEKFKNFSVYNGLQDEEFNVGADLLTKGGEIFFGGINGFNVFNPDSLPQNKNIPPVILTGFELFNKPVITGAPGAVLQRSILETKEIKLAYDQSDFSFEFAALNFTIPEQNEYAYKLVGFDEDWNYAGTQRKATYTNLDPGTYTFKVRGSNNDGLWNTDGVSIKIIIIPPYWATWWFRLGGILLILSMAIAFYKFRINIIEAQKNLLQLKVKEQTSQLMQSTREEQKARHEAEKARQEAEKANKELEQKNTELEQFAYIASHDLQEPLRTTSSFIQLLQKQYHGQLDNKADKYFTFILDASERMKLLIKNLLEYSRIGNKKELEMVDCKKKLQEVIDDLGIAIEEAGALITYDSLPVVSGYPLELKQLFQNLVTNAIKFRKKDTTPTLNISVRKIRGFWEFAFKDNGIGIDEKFNEKIFVIFQRLHTRTEYEGSGIGLSHCKKIVELHQGKIWLHSTPGQGTTFYFTIKEIAMFDNS